MSTTDVDTVATDIDLANELLGSDALSKLMPNDWNDAKPARQVAFDKVLNKLANRVPPIREADLSTIAELKEAIVYGALELMFQAAITTGDPDAVHTKKYTIYEKKFAAATRELRPSVAGGALVGGSGFSIAIFRG